MVSIRMHVQAGEMKSLLCLLLRLVCAAEMSGADETSRLVSQELSRFFSNLTISLQGIELSYNSMQLSSQTSGADGDVLELNLDVAVLDFPPPNLDF